MAFPSRGASNRRCDVPKYATLSSSLRRLVGIPVASKSQFELRVARSGVLLVCSLFARSFCAIRDFAGDEVGSRDPGSTSRRQPACKASTVLAEFAIGTMLKSKAGWEWATQPARLCCAVENEITEARLAGALTVALHEFQDRHDCCSIF